MDTTPQGGFVGSVRGAARFMMEHPRLRKSLQLILVVATVAFCAWAVRNEWSKAGQALEHANLGYLALAFAAVAAYYLVFILGWMRVLDAWGIHIPYRIALQAEMVSMLAKYVAPRTSPIPRACSHRFSSRQRFRRSRA
jgi:uncharacterized membrane protein YbhN (UPF0104 family)